MKKFLLFSLFAIIFILPSCNHSGEKDSDIEGTWVMENPPKEGIRIELNFNKDGSFEMFGYRGQESKTLQGSWSKNGDNVYISNPEEKEVKVMEIKSLDAHSLVIHFQGESEDKIFYFTRK